CKEHGLKCEFITPSSKRGPPKGVPKKNSQQELSNKSDTLIQTEEFNITPNYSPDIPNSFVRHQSIMP
ncbi:10773_t:CDS:2, partial [Dentiscutata erythropus]